MDKSSNIIIPITREARQALDRIEKKYKLTETREETAHKIKERKLFKMNVVVKLTRDLMLEKVSTIEFLDCLYKELGISKEDTKKLAIDTMHNLIPLLEKIPENQLASYNQKKKLEEKRLKEEAEEKINKQKTLQKPTAQELLIEKIKQGIPEDRIFNNQLRISNETVGENNQASPVVKKVDVKSVEESAEKLKKQREETAHPGTTGGELQRKGQTDPYREAIG